MQPNQWQQQQQPFGYGQPTYQQSPAFLQTQPTGFPGAVPQQRPMATGFPQQQPQPSGGLGAGQYSFLSAPPPSGSFGSQRSSFSGHGGLAPQATGFPGGGASGLMAQQTGYPGLMSQPTGMPSGGLMSQPTGMGGLRPQPTGLPHDPRLQTMMQSFMPSNLSQPFSSQGVPQFNQSQSQPLTQTFQTLLQNPSVNTPKVPWALSRQEKKDYDQIFRAWDTKGDGFISGDMAQEVFGQSGLGQEDLMKIWNLADMGNRGKLNLPEFHIAMGLIYRALNGNTIPDKLPDEMVPPSMRDIDSTVTFMKDLLKHEAQTRSDTSSPVYGAGTPVSAASAKDAKVYKHDDSQTVGYRSSSRHLDRKTVRYKGEDPSAEITDLRRQLENSSAMLEESGKAYARKTEEDELLEQEVDDIKYRVKRIKEDIDYVSKGRRTAEKEEERRKLEREMLYLMHEKLPELERRQERREEEKRLEERAGVRARDRRNDVHGRFDDRDRDHDWLRGSYERERRGSRDRDFDRGARYDRDREFDRRRDDDYRRDSDAGRRRFDDDSRRDDQDRDRERDRDWDRERDRGYNADRQDRPRAPPSPPKAPAAPAAPAAPPPPAPKSAGPSLAKMSPEERKQYLKEQAQRKIQERLRALGVEPAAADTPVQDDSVEERLARERAEAQEKAKAADQEQAAREEARRQRLAAVTGEDTPKAAETKPVAPPAPPVKPASRKPGPPPAPQPRHHKAPPAPRPQSKAPTAPAPPAPTPPAPAPPAPAPPAEDPEDAELRAREEAAARRRERLKKLQEEEEEDRRREEEIVARRTQRSAAPPTEPPAAAALSPSAPGAGSHNPFHRRSTDNTAASPSKPTAAPAAGGFNPFFRPPPAAASSTTPAAPAPPPPPPPAPPVIREPVATKEVEPEAEPEVEVAAPPAPPPAPPAPPMPTAPPQFTRPEPTRANSAPPPDDDWDNPTERDLDESDSSDDEYASSRDKRGALASALFGNIMNPTGSRPNSAGASGAPPAAPPAPKAPSKALANLGGGAPSGGGMSALLASIQGGSRLKHTVTVDRSGPGITGRVVGGDATPPAHINSDPVVRSPAALNPTADDTDDFEARDSKRQSTDWYSHLAADSSHPAAAHMENLSLEPTHEEEEPPAHEPITPAHEPITHENGAAGVSDGPSLDDVDLKTTLRVRSLFPYQTTFDGDLPFDENVVLEANPAKDPNGPWWYGTLPTGNKGWFPSTFVQEIEAHPATALYDYSGTTPEELSFTEGESLSVVDTSDHDWFKVEKAGAIFVVPATYVELLG